MRSTKFTKAMMVLFLMSLSISADAAFDENLNSYTLDSVIVEGEAIKDQFGNTITEQSYYRTGGEVMSKLSREKKSKNVIILM